MARRGILVRVIEGRCREARAYLRYCFALLRPGMVVPVFEAPSETSPQIDTFDDAQLQVVLDEGRRQVDRQRQDLERVQNRAATALTIGLAEIALLSNGGNTVLRAGWPYIMAWLLAVFCVFLGVAGASSLLTARPAVSSPTVTDLASYKGDSVLYAAAYSYEQSVGMGEVTLSARVTVLRDLALLLVLGGMIYAAIWPFVQAPS